MNNPPQNYAFTLKRRLIIITTSVLSTIAITISLSKPGLSESNNQQLLISSETPLCYMETPDHKIINLDSICGKKFKTVNLSTTTIDLSQDTKKPNQLLEEINLKLERDEAAAARY